MDQGQQPYLEYGKMERANNKKIDNYHHQWYLKNRKKCLKYGKTKYRRISGGMKSYSKEEFEILFGEHQFHD